MPQSHFLSATIKYNSPRKCNILIVTCALGICLIYIYVLALGHCMPSGVVGIYQANPLCPCYNLYIYVARLLMLDYKIILQCRTKI